MMKRARSAIAVAFLVAAGPLAACGLEDPSSIASRRGGLEVAFPKALHVGTAVWQAQLAGTLPRDPIAQRGDLSPEARGAIRLLRANGLLGKLAARWKAVPAQIEATALAVVLVGPVLWTRFTFGAGEVRTQYHAEGPQAGDVVAVTDIAVIDAIAEGQLDFAQAIEQGVLRLYGEPTALGRAQRWLASR